jgi:hypothetical protein
VRRVESSGGAKTLNVRLGGLLEPRVRDNMCEGSFRRGELASNDGRRKRRLPPLLHHFPSHVETRSTHFVYLYLLMVDSYGHAVWPIL